MQGLYRDRFQFRTTLKRSNFHSGLTLEEVETFLSAFDAPSEGSNRQNRTKTTEIAAFISRKISRSRVRIKKPNTETHATVAVILTFSAQDKGFELICDEIFLAQW